MHGDNQPIKISFFFFSKLAYHFNVNEYAVKIEVFSVLVSWSYDELME